MMAISQSPMSDLAFGADLGAIPAAVVDAEESVARNLDVISPAEQDCLGAMRVLVAGCGSVGGAVVEPLVRLGLGSIVLADPEDYDLTNINRQACLRSDVGRGKAEVLAERVRSINPAVETLVLPNGITEDNLDEALTDVSVAFDGVDAAMSPWAKFRLHERACELRIPVISGMDFGGKAVIYVFDYRTPDVRPFYGKSSADAHRSGRLDECLRWIGYSHFPADFLPVIADRMRTRRPWPQVSYCVLAMGALGARSALDLAMGRRLPHVVSFDTHMQVRRPQARLAQYARLPGALLSTLRTVRSRSAEAPAPAVRVVNRVEDYLQQNPVLKRVVEAFILAPSPHNAQPWRLKLEAPNRVAVCWDSSRALPAVDPFGHAAQMGLGCGIEAAATIADFEFEPGASNDIFSPEYRAGTLHVRGLKTHTYMRGMALLRRRCTNRHAFLDGLIPHHVEARCVEAAGQFGVKASFARLDPRRLDELSRSGAQALFARADYLDEFLTHLRLTSSEASSSPLGFTQDTLGVGKSSVSGMALLRQFPKVRNLAGRAGLARVMAAAATSNVTKAAGHIVVATDDWSARGRVMAGRALMAVWLELTKADLACQPVDFPISYEEGRRAVNAMFGLHDGLRAFAFLRVGRPLETPTRRAPRLPASAICELD